jgi:hypothetical protein
MNSLFRQQRIGPEQDYFMYLSDHNADLFKEVSSRITIEL